MIMISEVHIRYHGHRARVSIDGGRVLEGRLPPTIGRIMRDWTALRRQQLLQNWEAARSDAPLERIAGLDDD
jgi:Domain of unknown function (DUF4160)